MNRPQHATYYHALPTATYPAISAPKNMVNSPGVNSKSNIRVVPNFTVPSKIDCCAACAQIFNCVWWKFDFGSSAHDPWALGTCHYAYHTDNTLVAGGPNYNVPAICPNGNRDGTLQVVTPAFDGGGLNGTGYNGGSLCLFGSL